MLKVVLILKELHIRLKDGQVDIVISKGPINLLLGKNIKIITGQAAISTTIQFYICENNAIFTLIFYLLLGNERKHGGNISVNILDSQPNVYYKTVTQLVNSPDKYSRINFQFYYFKQNCIQDSRKLFLCHQRHDQQYKNIKSQTAELLQERIELQVNITQLKKLNGELEQGHSQKLLQLNEKQCLHEQRMRDCKTSMMRSEQQYLVSKSKRQKLERLTQEYGIQCCFKQQNP